MEILEQVFGRIEAAVDDMVGLQQELTAVPALSPENGGDGEWAKAEVLQSALLRLGLPKPQLFAAPDPRVSRGSRPNLAVSLPGPTDRPRLWIMTHLDVVPPGDPSLWSGDPYTAVRRGELLVGRGVEDNQQGIVSSVFAAASLAALGVSPARPAGLLFVADEETGSEYGIRHLLASQKLFAPGEEVLVPDSGSPDGSLILLAEKSLLWLRFETRGRQCHASTPAQGINAFLAGSEVVMRLQELHQVFAQANPLFDPPVSTFVPTKKEPNVPNINTVPASDVFYLDCRVLPEIELERILRRIQLVCREVEHKYGVQVLVSEVQRVSSPTTPADGPLVEALREAVQRVYGTPARPHGIGGGTVAAYLRQAGIPTAVWARLEETAHAPDEHCRIENMVGDAKVMAAVMLAPAGR